jgi:hypothetical protein
LRANLAQIHPDLIHHDNLQQPPGDVVESALLESFNQVVDLTEGSGTFHTSLRDPGVWMNLMELLERPYFRRRWVAQEVSLNDSVWVSWDNRLLNLTSLCGCRVHVYALHHDSRSISIFHSRAAYYDIRDIRESKGGMYARSIMAPGV